MTELSIQQLSKVYGGLKAIDDIGFTVADGEFVTLLGPSGCGKSTTLAAIAGLDQPTGGSIRAGERLLFDGERNVFVPAEQRNFGLVFQSYALWPHRTVFDNVAFPLKLRKVGAVERRRRIEEVLALVEMTDFAGRYPHELSGGQQQRVALARTLVYRPAVLLLDEPLSNLDAKLRERARVWLGQLKTQVRLTTIYVTHDQSEALALSDRIVVMNKGRIVQIGTPYEIYSRPAEPFVADFIGTSTFFPGTVAEVGTPGRCLVVLPDGQALSVANRGGLKVEQEVRVAVRPENISIIPAKGSPIGADEVSLPARILSRSFLGARFEYELDVAGTHTKVETPDLHDEPEVRIVLPASSAMLFPTMTRNL